MIVTGSTVTDKVLSVTVRFITDTYEAEVNGKPEWPPHPHRLFAAFVAAAGPNRTAAEHDTLMWLETLPPPVIDAPTVATNLPEVETGPVQFVPTAGVAYNAIRPGLSDGFMPSSKAAASRNPPGTKPTALKAYGAKTEPRVYLLGDTCRFWWHLTSVTPDIESRCAVLRQLGRRVPYLGRASTFVTVVSEITDVPSLSEQQQRWEPRRGAAQVRSIFSGLLETLDGIHGDTIRGHNRKGKPGPSPRWVHTVPYACEPERPGPTEPQKPVRNDLLVLRFVDGPQPAVHAPRLASQLVESVTTVVGPDDIDVVCLPRVGDRYATGELYGFLVRSNLETLQALHQLVSNGAVDIGARVAPVNQTLNTTKVLSVERWAKPSPTWVTALPWTPRKKCWSTEIAADWISQDLVEAGFAEPVTVTCQKGPYLTGAAHCSTYQRLSAFHAVAVFSEPVSGPVRIGTRHLGLFLPVHDDTGDSSHG